MKTIEHHWLPAASSYQSPLVKVVSLSMQRHILSPTTGSTISDAEEEEDDIFGD